MICLGFLVIRSTTFTLRSIRLPIIFQAQLSEFALESISFWSGKTDLIESFPRPLDEGPVKDIPEKPEIGHLPHLHGNSPKDLPH